MDKDIGLPSLPDKSVDLCLTDPPWNIGYDGVRGSSGQKTGENPRIKKEFYLDKIPNYRLFTLKWFYEIKRICERIIVAPGRQNLKMWYELTEPLDIIVHTKKNGGYGGRLSMFNDMDIYLYFGKPVSRPYWRSNVFRFNNMPAGFIQRDDYLHTSPKIFGLWDEIIKGINPESVIDPFLGSGTSAEVCTKLGIPWLGYEINEVYSQDINKRLKNLKREPKQTTLELLTHK